MGIYCIYIVEDDGSTSDTSNRRKFRRIKRKKAQHEDYIIYRKQYGSHKKDLHTRKELPKDVWGSARPNPSWAMPFCVRAHEEDDYSKATITSCAAFWGSNIPILTNWGISAQVWLFEFHAEYSGTTELSKVWGGKEASLYKRRRMTSDARNETGRMTAVRHNPAFSGRGRKRCITYPTGPFNI